MAVIITDPRKNGRNRTRGLLFTFSRGRTRVGDRRVRFRKFDLFFFVGSRSIAQDRKRVNEIAQDQWLVYDIA